MWVFGYGSLVWDGWEHSHGCIRRKVASLRGYRRSFNKASTVNWGTKQHPGPTLNILPSDRGRCRGIAFEFPDDRAKAVMDYLKTREGPGFELEIATLRLSICSRVKAFVPIYRGKNVFARSTVEELAEMALFASGKDGSCVDYVFNLERGLAESGIRDSVVTTFASMIREKMEAQQPA